MIKIKILWDNPRYEVDDGRDYSQSEWDRPDTDGTLEIHGYELAKDLKNSYREDLATIKEDNGVIFAIFSCYDSGDSFGHDSNYFQFIEAFSDSFKAEVALQKINKYIENKESLVTYTNDVEEERKIYLSGLNDYFGRINYIEIHEIHKNKFSKRKITYH